MVLSKKISTYEIVVIYIGILYPLTHCFVFTKSFSFPIYPNFLNLWDRNLVEVNFSNILLIIFILLGRKDLNFGIPAMKGYDFNGV